MDFRISVEVHLGTPRSLVSDDGKEVVKLVGFVQELAVRADDEAGARELTHKHIAGYEVASESALEIIFIEIHEIEDEDVPHDARGVWFASGRSFYSQE